MNIARQKTPLLTPTYAKAAESQSNVATQKNAPKTPADRNPEDSAQIQDREFDPKNFSWTDLGKGLAGAVLGGTIVGTGGAVVGLTEAPEVTYESVKGVRNSEMLGPVLKNTITPVVIAAGLLSPILVTLGSVGYGMVEGFAEGAKKNPAAAATESVEIVKKMRGLVTDDLIDGIRKAASAKPESPDDVLEIKVKEAGTALASGVLSAGADSVGAAAITAINLPELYARGTSEIWDSEASLPLKVGGQLLGTGLAALAIPLATVGGALYGLGSGAKIGYTEGFSAAGGQVAEDLKDYHQMLRDAGNDN